MKTQKQLIDEIIEETEQIINPIWEKVQEELDVEKIVRIMRKSQEKTGDPLKYTREQQLLEFHKSRLNDVKKIRTILNETSTEELEYELKRTKPEYSEYWKRDIQRLVEIVGGYRACLENSIDLIKGKDYDEILGKDSGWKHPNIDNLKEIDQKTEEDKFAEIREKHVHKLLTASSILNRWNDKVSYKVDFNEEDVQKAEQINQKIEELRRELRKRAEHLDTMLTRASERFQEGEEQKDNTNWINRDEIPEYEPEKDEENT